MCSIWDRYSVDYSWHNTYPDTEFESEMKERTMSSKTKYVRGDRELMTGLSHTRLR